jgi:coenzyme F420 hydrogenase subunit beta
VAVTESRDSLGEYKDAFLVFARDESIRKQAAGGGAVTAILTYLLEKRKVDGTIIVRMSRGNPWLPEVSLGKTRNDVLDAQQSKYVMIPVNMAFRKIKSQEGKYAMVGLPCHIHAFRRLQKVDVHLSRKVVLTIGLFCGCNMNIGATLSLLRRLKVRYLNDIARLEYRGGSWPGGFRVSLRDGKKLFVKKSQYNYLIPLYVPRACLLCTDYSNELADVSVGDVKTDFTRGEESRWSFMLARTTHGTKAVRDAYEAGYLILKKIETGKILKGHRFGINFKKTGGRIRRRYTRSILGGEALLPNELPPIATRRVFLELGLLAAIKLSQLRPVRAILERAPLRLLDGVINAIHQLWTRGE